LVFEYLICSCIAFDILNLKVLRAGWLGGSC